MIRSTGAIASLAPITLTELDAVAALRTRKDRKYLVPAAEVERLVAGAGAGAKSRVLEIDGLRTFRYESVYFDTPDLACYRAAARRRPRRSKVRTRSNLDRAVAFLEVKARQGRGLTVKHRLAYGLSDRHRITPEGLAFLEAVSSVGPLADRLRPALKTRYRRTTLLAEDAASRVTIDECLECVAPGRRQGGSRLGGAHRDEDGGPSFRVRPDAVGVGASSGQGEQVRHGSRRSRPLAPREQVASCAARLLHGSSPGGACGRASAAVIRRSPVRRRRAGAPPITGGSSVGALLDGAGRLVGITTAVGVSSVGAEGMGFAIPVESISALLWTAPGV